VVRVTNAMLPLLKRSDAPVIVNVSSGMGSLGITTDPDRFESGPDGRTGTFTDESGLVPW
jgi:hypothetical protein